MASRPRLPVETETNVLTRSRRRCCVCFGLHGDSTVKDGQIAHLNQTPSDNREDNLAFLCLKHHNEFDSKPSVAKGLTASELKQYRDELYAFNHAKSPSEVSLRVSIDFDSFSEEKASELLEFIRAGIKLNGEIIMLSKERGSTIVNLWVESSEDAKRIVEAVKRGLIPDVTEAWIKQGVSKALQIDKSRFPVAPDPEKAFQRLEEIAAILDKMLRSSQLDEIQWAWICWHIEYVWRALKDTPHLTSLRHALFQAISAPCPDSKTRYELAKELYDFLRNYIGETAEVTI